MSATTERKSDGGIGSSNLLSGGGEHCDMCNQVTDHPLTNCPGLPQIPRPGVLYAGKYRISNHRPAKVGEPGKYWLENGDGEGLETTEAKIEAMMADFFRREF